MIINGIYNNKLIVAIPDLSLNSPNDTKATSNEEDRRHQANAMSIGPGKYDLETTMVQKETNAQGVILIIIDGKRGSGFSVQATLEVTLAIPGMLRTIADKMEADISTMEVKS